MCGTSLALKICIHVITVFFAARLLLRPLIHLLVEVIDSARILALEQALAERGLARVSGLGHHQGLRLGTRRDVPGLD